MFGKAEQQMNYLERAREFFRNDHYATDATGIVIENERIITPPKFICAPYREGAFEG